jgi:alpha-beta hydrolase superfamily lysophospholipase
MHETSLNFGSDGGLIGTVCLPGDGARKDVALVLFNAGIVHRVGPHRLYVNLARELARHGVASIRFDLHGMGDSQRSTAPVNRADQVVADLRDAMDELQRQSGAEKFTLLGFCSGVPQSCDAALVDARVDHVILYDGFAVPTRRAGRRYLWQRLRAHGFGSLAPRLWLRRLAEWFAMRLRWRSGTRAGASASEDLVATLRALRERGVRVTVLHSGADFSVVNYPMQAAEHFGAAVSGLCFGFLPDVDHVLTSRQAQRSYIDWVLATLLPAGAAAGCAR